ncbi:circadian clock-controlled protein-like [Cimex lectularius]|uniref:Protein takeout-like n=1 Tax=Cimex lectularius TaxID=79782 RepID=A0A8I6R968_CIMLE|nr:circadian clock-controlled protein-like [Cimex lectularius]
MINHFAVLVLNVGLISASGLPPWIKPCKVGPKFDECSIKNGKFAMPYIMKGDPKYQVPTMDPLFIPELSITEDQSKSIAMNITLRNTEIRGLRNSNFVSSKYDAQRKHFEWVFDNLDLQLFSDYKISGKFLLLPIVGNGHTTITIKDVKLMVYIDYKTEKRNDEDYAVIKNLDIKYTTKRLTINLENLFNGNRELGNNINGLMNLNWRELNNSLGPGVTKAIAIYLKQVLDNILKTVPVKEIFL